MRGERTERLIRIASKLLRTPSCPVSLTALSDEFDVSKTVISDDISILAQSLSREGWGRLVVDRGRSGGAYFQCFLTAERRQQVLENTVQILFDAARRLPAGFIYYADVLFNPEQCDLLGMILATIFAEEKPTIVMTSEVKGIPLGFSTARALGVPLALCRFRNRASDGPAVCVHYPTPTGEARAVYMGTKQLSSEDRVLIVDDFVRGGSTLAGMCQVAEEFGSEIVGKGAFIMSKEPEQKTVGPVTSLLLLGEDKTVEINAAALQ